MTQNLLVSQLIRSQGFLVCKAISGFTRVKLGKGWGWKEAAVNRWVALVDWVETGCVHFTPSVLGENTSFRHTSKYMSLCRRPYLKLLRRVCRRCNSPALLLALCILAHALPQAAMIRAMIWAL